MYTILVTLILIGIGFYWYKKHKDNFTKVVSTLLLKKYWDKFNPFK